MLLCSETHEITYEKSQQKKQTTNNTQQKNSCFWSRVYSTSISIVVGGRHRRWVQLQVIGSIRRKGARIFLMCSSCSFSISNLIRLGFFFAQLARNRTRELQGKWLTLGQERDKSITKLYINQQQFSTWSWYFSSSKDKSWINGSSSSSKLIPYSPRSNTSMLTKNRNVLA